MVGAGELDVETENDESFDPLPLPLPLAGLGIAPVKPKSRIPSPYIPFGIGTGPTGVGIGSEWIDIAGAALTAIDACVSATCAEYSESFSPTQVRVNQRPPAMPLISRCATRQFLTFFWLLSILWTGLTPAPILIGAATGKGLAGKG